MSENHENCDPCDFAKIWGKPSNYDQLTQDGDIWSKLSFQDNHDFMIKIAKEKYQVNMSRAY